MPPRSVADVARFTTNRSTDLIAVVKQWSRERKDKSGESIVDVELIDNSELTQGKLATVKVSVFGTSKVGLVKLSTGEPMVFLNLSVSCVDGKPQITHYKDALAQAAPECGKTASLKAKGGELAEATNTERLTSDWTPQQARSQSTASRPVRLRLARDARRGLATRCSSSSSRSMRSLRLAVYSSCGDLVVRNL